MWLASITTPTIAPGAGSARGGSLRAQAHQHER